MIKLKGRPIQEWKNWVDNELSPPTVSSPEVLYVLEALKESIKIIENLKS